MSLILLWSQFEVLFNPKYSLCYSIDENKAILKIKDKMKENGVDNNVKAISEIISSLRRYDEAQRRKIESSKKWS